MISGSFVAGSLVSVVLVLGFAGFAVLARRKHAAADPDDIDRPMWTYGLVLAVIGVVATVGVTAFSMWPYDMQYHSYRHVAGTVQQIDARMLADGHATTQEYAVRMDGDTYRCDDSRCALVKPGDELELWCIREWQYAATSGWVCNFDSTRPRAAS